MEIQPGNPHTTEIDHWAAGQVLLHYEVHEKLGQGGHGVVYKALDQKLNRFVALKFLSPRLLSSAPVVDRFLQEARALSALNHPHIATIHDLEHFQGQRFLVLEYLGGGTLSAKLQQLQAEGRHFPFGEILQYAQQAAEGLKHAHRRGIIHRDIKTSNLMLTEDGILKITDFGVAKLRGSSADTTPGSLVGTVAYMSPEQAQGLAVDSRTDIFSFGVVLFELITGRLPFEAPDFVGVLAKVTGSSAPPLRTFRADVPEALEEIVGKTLIKPREQRFQKMEELLQELNALRQALLQITVVRRTQTSGGWFWKGWGVGRRAMIVAALLVLGVAIFLLVREGVLRGTWLDSLPAERRLAVLPFHNLDRDQADEAVSEGMTEILTNKLTQLEQFQGSLHVVSASDVLKEGITAAKEARSSFGATLAVTGSVHRAGGEVLLTANLVDTQSQLVLAGRDLKAPREDLFGLQEQLVEKVTEMLQLQLQPEARQALATDLVSVPRAYELYLQGRGYLRRYDRTESLDRALAAFHQALEQDPAYAPAYAGIAEAQLRRYQLTRDLQFLTQARTTGLHAIELEHKLVPAHITMGLIELARGNYQEAIHGFEVALQLDPKSADAFRELANVYDAAGSTALAESTYRRALELRPDDWAANKDLAVFFNKHGRLADSVFYFKRVIELTPDNYLGYRNLGALYLRLGRHSDAVAMLEKSLALKLTDRAYSILGSAYYFQNRYRDAIDPYRKAAELNPTDPRHWGNLADAYRWSIDQAKEAPGAYRKASDLTEKELLINPQDAELRANLAFYHSSSGEQEKALKEITHALQSAPSSGYLLLRAAMIYEQAGMRSRALQSLEGALKDGYSFEEIHKAPELTELRKDPRYRQLARPHLSKSAESESPTK